MKGRKMRRIPIELPVGYTIRFAKKEDISDIMLFFKEHWKESHILAKDRGFFEYEFCRGDEVCMVLLLNDKNGIEGTLGYIPYGGELRDIFTVMWKVLDNGQMFAGVGLFYYLIDHGRCRHIFTSGLNESTRNIYKYLGFETGNLQHFYMLNTDCESRIAEIRDETEINTDYEDSGDMLSLRAVTDRERFLADYISETKEDRIHKSSEYMVRRYFDHPKYQYIIYQLWRNGEKTDSFLIAREQRQDGSAVLRLIDFVGDETLLACVGTPLRQIMRENRYEYTDMYVFGVNDDILCRAGFTKKKQDSANIIPNYFSPFCRKNVNIGIFWEKEMHPIIWKGDGDQDRPSE